MKEGKFSLFSIIYNIMEEKKNLIGIKINNDQIRLVPNDEYVFACDCVCAWISITKWNQFKNVWHWNGLTDISIAVVEPTGFTQKSQQLMTQVHQTHAIRFGSLALKNNNTVDAQRLFDQNEPLFYRMNWKKNAVLAKPDFIAIQFQNMHISKFYSLACQKIAIVY